MNNIVFLVAGGTGGHLFPAISLAKSFKNKKPIFLIDKRVEKIFFDKDFDYFVIPSSKIHNIIIKFPLIFFKISIGFIYSFFLILKKKPSIVVGFGGYTSIPAILAAKILNKKIIIHEQNSIMGRTNRILSKVADKITINYKNTIFADKTAIVTGIPIRIGKKFIKENRKKKTILVIGGSQGAKFFSEAMIKIVKNLNHQEKKKIFIVQQILLEDKEEISKFYQKLNLDYKVSDFFENIYHEFYNADIILSRCGASSLAEIEYFKKFSILFPLPSATNNHQYKNALEFKKNNKCEIFMQNNIDFKKLTKVLKNQVFSNNNTRSHPKKQKKLSLEAIINDMLS